MPRNSGIKTGRWSVRFSSGSRHHGPHLHSKANFREILEVWQRSPGLSMGMGFPWESHGKCPLGWDGTARIAFPMGPMGQ